jgi:type IV pilus assembly protein PilP
MLKLLLILNLILFQNIKAEETYKFIHGNTLVKNPLDLRDPFKRKMIKRKNSITSKVANTTGIYKNYDDSIENKPIESFKIVGVMTGSERRAMVKTGKNSETYIIKEGMRLGPNQAEVKAILPGGVILLEKIRNVYDQDEYLETVLPVSGE